MRRTELTAARRGALARISATQAAVPQQIVGTLTGIDPDDAGKVQVSVGGASSLSIVAAAGKYVPGALVLIAVDAAGKPLRVLGPLTDRPEGLDAEADPPSPIWAWPALAPREITEAEAQAILDTAAGLTQTQEDLEAAKTEIDTVVKPALEGAQADAANAATDAANALAAAFDLIKVGPVDPGHAPGRLWIQIVDGLPKGAKISDGSTWTSFPLFSESLFVVGQDGTVAIREGVIDAPMINVSSELWAALLVVAGDATIGGRLLVDGAIGARELNVVPEEGMGGARIDGQGIEIIPAGEDGVSAIRLRADDDTWITFVKDSAATFSVSPDGDLTAQNIYANAALVYRGMELEEILAPMSRGVLAHTVLLADMIFSTSWARACFATFEAVAGRRYTAKFTGQFDATSTGIKVAVRQSSGSSVSSSNTIKQSWSVPASRASYPATAEYTYHFDSDLTGTVSVGFFVRTQSGNARALTTGSSIDGTATTMITIEDGGLAPEIATVPGYTTVSGYSSGSNTDTSTSTYTKTVSGSWGRSFKIDGGFIAGGLANKAVQGDSGGSWRMGMVGFPSIIGDLSGATVKKIEIYVYFEHWYYNTGGTAGIGYHGQTSAPGSWSGSTASIQKGGIPKPGGVWVTLPSDTYASWKSGAYRGITVRAPGDSSDRIYYGYANPARCQLRYTYTK